MITTTASSAPSTGRRAPGAVADERELFLRWQRHGDEAAREALLDRFMPLARSLVRRYARSSEPLEDLLQVASFGLIKALDRYDVERGRPFASFAVPTILGEMRRHFRDCGWSVHVPRAAQERALKVRDAAQRLESAQGRPPTVNQLAEYLEIDTEQIVDALQAINAYETHSLDAPRAGGEGPAEPYKDTVGADDERYELVELDATVCSALQEIPARERLILHLRFVEEMSQTEIAQRVGISQMQVSRLLRGSLEQLRQLS